MADRGGLKFVGFIFATVTLAVMLATGMVVKGYADGAYSLERSADRRADKSPSANHSGQIARKSRWRSAAPDQRQHHHRQRPTVRQTGS